jgi:single-strand DNA-binding protein
MVNEVILLGNTGNDPKIINASSGKIAKFSLATSESYKDKNGERKTLTEWHNCVVFGKLADIVEEYVKKGMQLYVNGKIKYGEYESDGVKKYTTDIIVNTLKMVSKPEKKEEKPAERGGNNYSPVEVTVEKNDDLPF